MDNKQIYYSFHDMPDSGWQPLGVRQPKPTLRFTRTELLHIAIALSVLTLAFAFVFAPYPPLANLDSVITNIPLSFVAIATAFFCHELAHKYMGQRYGYWSEFRMFPQGLLFALFMGIFVGIVFAAPGAVQIFGRPTRKEGGIISAAGPATNIAISFFFTAIWLVTSGLLSTISLFIASINAFLAFFNLLPFGPLDGRKILSWRVEVWAFLITISICLFIAQVLL